MNQSGHSRLESHYQVRDIGIRYLAKENVNKETIVKARQEAVVCSYLGRVNKDLDIMLTIMHSGHRERGLITIIFSLDMYNHGLERGRVSHTSATSENIVFFKTVSFIPSIIPFSMTAKSSSDISFILF